MSQTEVETASRTQPEGSQELVWIAPDGRAWRITLQPSRVLVESDGERLELPSERWTQDIYAASHGDGFIVRFETFARAIGFILDAPTAEPLLRHVARHLSPRQAVAAEASEAPRVDVELLWPKVSSLAVWALICSATAFLPVIGVITAAAAISLLILHRIQVRRSAAWSHSRIICRVAWAMTAVGLGVSALSTHGLYKYLRIQADDAAPALFRNEDVGRSGPPTETTKSGSHDRPKRSFLAGVPVVAALSDDHNWGMIVASLLVLVLALTLHEAAHAISAWWLGDDFAKRSGRVTLNPLAHIDPIGTVLLPLALYLAGAGVFGWARPVPVRLDHVPRPRRAGILIALAGPASNLLLASASLMALMGIGCGLRLWKPHAGLDEMAMFGIHEMTTVSQLPFAVLLSPLLTILKLSFVVNVFLAFFNLIPIPPLDGSWVLQHLFPRTVGPFYAAMRPYAFVAFLGLIYSGVLTYLMIPGVIVVAGAFDLLQMCTAV